MGNTLIEDSVTGNIMGLTDGFIPVGIKEHGGILYIASYNPNTKKGELGTIPSPLLQYTYDELKKMFNAEHLTDIAEASQSLPFHINANYFVLWDKVMHVGDKFMVKLDLSVDQSNQILINTSDYKRNIFTNDSTTRNTKQYTYRSINSFQSINGAWYKIELYSILFSGKIVNLSSLIDTNQDFFTEEDPDLKHSDYWFIDEKSTDIINHTIDTSRCISGDLYKSYPNIPSGKLAIKIVPILPTNFQLIENTSYGCALPSIHSYLSDDNKTYKYRVVIPGFTYKSKGAIQVDQIDISCKIGDIDQTVYGYSFGTSSLIPSQFVPVTQRYEIAQSLNNPGTQLQIFTSQNPYQYDSNDILSQRLINVQQISGHEHLKRAPLNQIYDTIISNEDNELTHILSYSFIPYNDTRYYSVNFQEGENDGLFFVPIDSLNNTLEFTVKLYTKDFDSSTNEYILFDSIQFSYNPTLGNQTSSLFTQIDEDEETVNQQYTFDSNVGDSFHFKLKNGIPLGANDVACKYNDLSKSYEPINQSPIDVDKMKIYVYPTWMSNGDRSEAFFIASNLFGGDSDNSNLIRSLISSRDLDVIYPVGSYNSLVQQSMLNAFRDMKDDIYNYFTVNDLIKNGIFKTNLRIQLNIACNFNEFRHGQGNVDTWTLSQESEHVPFNESGKYSKRIDQIDNSLYLSYLLPALNIAERYNSFADRAYAEEYVLFISRILESVPGLTMCHHSYQPGIASGYISKKGWFGRNQFPLNVSLNYTDTDNQFNSATFSADLTFVDLKDISYLYTKQPSVTIQNRSIINGYYLYYAGYAGDNLENAPNIKIRFEEYKNSNIPKIEQTNPSIVYNKGKFGQTTSASSGNIRTCIFDKANEAQSYTLSLTNPYLRLKYSCNVNIPQLNKSWLNGLSGSNYTKETAFFTFNPNSQLFVDIYGLNYAKISDYRLQKIIYCKGSQTINSGIYIDSANNPIFVDPNVDTTTNLITWTGGTRLTAGFNSSFEDVFTNEYYKLDMNEELTCSIANNLTSGLYTFHLNESTEFTSNVRTKSLKGDAYNLQISYTENGTAKTFTIPLSKEKTASFYLNLPSGSLAVNMKLIRKYNNNNTSYFRNCGLYKVNDDSIFTNAYNVELWNKIRALLPSSTTTIQFINVNHLINNIVYPACCCYYEETSCNDQYYKWQALPIDPKFLVVQIYTIDNNDSTKGTRKSDYKGSRGDDLFVELNGHTIRKTYI